MKTQWYVQQNNEKLYEEFKELLSTHSISMSKFHNDLLPFIVKTLKSYNPTFRILRTTTEQIKL